MYIKILLQYIYGYISIKIEGFFVERVINRATQKNIFMWNIKKDKSTIVYLNIGVKEFKQLKKYVKESQCKINIVKKRGLPFLFHKYRKRKVFFATIIIILTSLFLMSNFVWNIEISGTNKIPQSELIESVKKKGISIGVLKNKIDTQKIINEIRLERMDISWIGIEIEGTNVIIKVVEAEQKPEIINEEEICNIIADKDAEIKKISAQSGVPLVKEGDIVKKGDILIAGWMEGKYTGTRYVHSNGEIFAKISYTEKERMELKQVTTKETGNQESKYEIKFNNFAINLYKTLSNFKFYDTIEKNIKIKLFSNFYLPIEFVKKTNIEKEKKEITYNIEEAKNICIENLSKKIEEQISGKEVLQKFTNYTTEKDYIDVEVVYEVLENIGTKEKIVF